MAWRHHLVKVPKYWSCRMIHITMFTLLAEVACMKRRLIIMRLSKRSVVWHTVSCSNYNSLPQLKSHLGQVMSVATCNPGLWRGWVHCFRFSGLLDWLQLLVRHIFSVLVDKKEALLTLCKELVPYYQVGIFLSFWKHFCKDYYPICHIQLVHLLYTKIIWTAVCSWSWFITSM